MMLWNEEGCSDDWNMAVLEKRHDGSWSLSITLILKSIKDLVYKVEYRDCERRT